MSALPEPTAYLYHDAKDASVLNAFPAFHSVLLVLAADRRPWARNETGLYTAEQMRAAFERECADPARDCYGSGCLSAPVAAEHQSDAPICPWCDRQGYDTCQHADDARTCGK